MTIFVLLSHTLAAAAAVSAPAPAKWAASAPQTEVPFTILGSGGSVRIVINVAFNGHRFPMMAHANAEFTAQLRHDRAAEFG